jgi:hypothetical protein
MMIRRAGEPKAIVLDTVQNQVCSLAALPTTKQPNRHCCTSAHTVVLAAPGTEYQALSLSQSGDRVTQVASSIRYTQQDFAKKEGIASTGSAWLLDSNLMLPKVKK